MSGGFFRGTTADQDTRFSNKQAKLLKTQKFHPELEHLVDVTKVKMDVIKPWIATRVTELLGGFEDEVLINFIYGLLEGKEINGKAIQIQLTGFMEKNTGKFMKELWALLLSAQKNASGVPQQFLDAKEEETKKKKAESDRIFNEIQRRKEQESEQAKERKLDGGRGNYSAEDANRRQERGSDSQSGEENGADVRNGNRGRNRTSKSPYSTERSPSPHRRSISRSVSPRPIKHSVSPDRIHRTPRRSVSPRRISHSRRSSSRTRYRSPSPMRRRVHSPVHRRSPSLARRRSPSPPRRRSPLRRRSPPRRLRSPSPWRRRTPSPRRRRSPSPAWQRRRRSTSSPRSRSPVQLRSQSPVRRQYRAPVRRRSPYPGHRSSPSPDRRGSPLPRRRRSPSPVRRRSPLPARRRSPVQARRRSPVQARRRSPTRSPSRSLSPDSRSSASPARRRFVSPIKMQSPRPPSSVHESPRGRSRLNDHVEPAMISRRQLMAMSPQRDLSDSNHSRRKVTSVSPSPSKSPSYSPESRSRSTGENRRLTSPYKSPKRAADRLRPDGSHSPLVEMKARRVRRGSPRTSEDELQNSRVDKRDKYKSTGRTDLSSGGKNRESPHQPSNRHRDSVLPRQKDTEMPSVDDSLKEANTDKGPAHRGSVSKEGAVIYPGDSSKSDDKKNSKGDRVNSRSDTLVDLHKKRRSPSVSSASGSEGSAKPKFEVAEKRKHKRSSRRDAASDSTSSDSEIEFRKEAKRRKKEEKKLRKEERRQRREERRRKREEKRASKRKRKSKNADVLSSDVDKHEKIDNASNGERGMRKCSSEPEEMESQKKRLENELREKALESLRAKKGISS